MIFLFLPLVLAVLLFPYGWMLFHRHRMIKRLRATGERLGFRWTPFGKGFLFAGNRSKRYQFCLENQEKVFLVKLWACYRRGTVLLVGEDGRVSVRSRYPRPLFKTEEEQSQRQTVDGAWRAVPKTRAPKTDFKGKQVIPVLLSYPTYDGVVYLRSDKMIPVRNGDTLFGKKFFTPSALERAMTQGD